MAKTFFKKTLASGSGQTDIHQFVDDIVQKNTRPAVEKKSGASAPNPPSTARGNVKTSTTTETKSVMPERFTKEIYDDQSVCQVLGIRRRVIAQARTKDARGTAWNTKGLHAGMTKDWVFGMAGKMGVDVRKLSQLEKIAEGDKIATVRLVGTWPNIQRVTVELLATGEKKIATVRDSRLMHLYDEFDCRAYAPDVLMYDESINRCQY